MAHCGAETLSDRDAILECPVPTTYSSTHGIVRARAQKAALDGFLGYDRLIMTIWCIGILRVPCIRPRRYESCEYRFEVCAYL